MGFGDSIRMGFSDAVKWASEKAEAGAKLVGEAVDVAKDAVVKTAEILTNPVSAVSSTVKEAPKPASLATTVQGVNSSFTDKIAYAWKKTSEMTTSLGTYAAMLTPVGAGVVAATKLINIGHNTYQNKETGDRVQILDKDKSITSVLKDSVWQTAISKSNDGKTTTEQSPTINTDLIISSLPQASTDDASGKKAHAVKKGSELTKHVDDDSWARIFNDIKTADALPPVSIEGDGKMVRASNNNETAKEAEVKVGKDNVSHKVEGGNEVKFDAQAQRLISTNGTEKTKVDVDRQTGNVEMTADGKGMRIVDGKRIWDVNGDQRVEQENGSNILKVYDRSNNLIQMVDKDSKVVTDVINGNYFVRGGGPIAQLRQKTRQVIQSAEQHRLDRNASGIVISAAEDGVSMTDKDGITVILKTDGNAFFELANGVNIWKDANDKYYILEAGKEPKEILDGSTGKEVEAQTREYLGMLKELANNKTLTRDGVKFSLDTSSHTVSVEVDEKTKMETGPLGAVLTAPDRPVSTLNTLTNEFTIGAGKERSTFKLDSDEVDTPYVHTDKNGTTLKKTGDWVGNNLEVKLADGTHYDLKGDVTFADGTVFHAGGEVTIGNNARLAADIQEQQIKQAATVLRNAEAVAETAKAKAASGLINYELIAQLEGSISQVGALMQMFSGNDAVRARLGMVMASLEAARNDAKTSFAHNTALRATRDAALAGNKVRPESVVLTTGYNPQLKMQFRFTADRSAA